jgi:hypothetical protein
MIYTIYRENTSAFSEEYDAQTEALFETFLGVCWWFKLAAVLGGPPYNPSAAQHHNPSVNIGPAGKNKEDHLSA